jgi:hypothetical protein
MEGGLSDLRSLPSCKEPSEASAAGPAWQTSGDCLLTHLKR